MPAPAAAPRGGLANRRAVIIAIAVGALAALVLLVILVTAGGKGPLEGGLTNGGGDLGGPPGGPIPPDGRPIPEGGTDVFLGGGAVGFPVPNGWELLARGDNKPGPGGHPENAVLVNSSAGVTLAVYVLPAGDVVSRVNDEATARAQEWTKDGGRVTITQPQGVQVGGSVTAAASLRYSYTQPGAGGGPREGELVIAARGDGFAIAVFVDAGQGGALDASQGVWGPLRGSVLRNFAGG